MSLYFSFVAEEDIEEDVYEYVKDYCKKHEGDRLKSKAINSLIRKALKNPDKTSSGKKSNV